MRRSHEEEHRRRPRAGVAAARRLAAPHAGNERGTGGAIRLTIATHLDVSDRDCAWRCLAGASVQGKVGTDAARAASMETASIPVCIPEPTTARTDAEPPRLALSTIVGTATTVSGCRSLTREWRHRHRQRVTLGNARQVGKTIREKASPYGTVAEPSARALAHRPVLVRPGDRPGDTNNAAQGDSSS